MFEKRFIIIVVLATVLIFGGGLFLLSSQQSGTSAAKVAFEDGGKVSVDQTSLDWGKIAFKGGFKEAFFTIKNDGDSVLRLKDIKTSCHCTKAEVIIDGQASPSFGMSGVSSWVGEVKPKEEAKLKVIFDPLYHGPQGIGPIERYIKVYTSDPQKRYLEFVVKGVVEK